MCDKHKHELEEIKKENSQSECSICFSESCDFEECSAHQTVNFPGVQCANCEALKALVRDFQSHNHTFTCKKKRKIITIIMWD